LPLDLPLVDMADLRFFAGVAVVVFLDASFWLSGWPGSALGVTLMGMALLLVMLMGQTLGVVVLALAVLIAALVLLLMLSDLPFARERGWSGRYISVGIGLAANLIVGLIVALLVRAFGRVPGL
jgi:hypothetical protein